ncbi:MAG TPA: hypothetical protein VIJ31_12190 [Acidothermaceae bacterium]
MATFPGAVASLDVPADTDVLGTGASMGGGITLADVLDQYAGEVVALETYLRTTPVNTNTSSGTTETMPDVGSLPMTALTLTANCVLTFPTAVSGGFVLQLIQDGTGGRTVTWPASSILQWAGGTKPTLSAAAGAVDIFSFVCFGGTHWYGGIFGQAMA